MTTKAQRAEAEKQKQEAIDSLHNLIPQGATVYTVLNNISSSGMSRRISVLCSYEGHIVNIGYWVSKACGFRINNNREIIIGGCGMDMGYHLVYTLASVLGYDKNSGNCYGLNQQWI